MLSLLRNALRLSSRPDLACDYVRYLSSRIWHRGEAVRTFPDGTKIGRLSGFGEFHSCSHFVSGTERRFLEKLRLEKLPILDVGANLGVFSLLMARLHPGCQIDAFEPNPTTFDAIEANVARNRCSNVRCHHAAVAGHDGEVPFVANPIDRATTHIARQEPSPNGNSVGVSTVLRVPCLTLDGFVRRHGISQIGLLKVDVEGFESLVFEGSRRLLESGAAQTIYYEVCPELTKRAGFLPEEASSRLLENGYRLHRIGANGRLEPVELERISATRLENWVAIHPRRPAGT